MENKIAVLFTGQGAQYPGMGKEIYDEFDEAKEVYDKANDILGFNISDICFNGRKDELNKTSICQPAILITSIAILTIVKNRCNGKFADCVVTCGLSLGEYTSHVFAGSIAFEDAVRLVHMRGQFMQEACEQNPGGMLAVLGLADKEIEDICEQSKSAGEICLANYNSPGQVVVSGELNLLDDVKSAVKEKGGRAVKLRVDGAFHSKLMNSAKERLREEIDKVNISRAQVPVIANVNGEYVSEPDEIRSALVEQLDNSVLWTQSMQKIIKNGVNEFYEFGPGNVLSGLLLKIDSSKEIKSIESIQSIKEVAFT